MNLKGALGIKTDEEITVEVEREPTIQDARNALGLADRILKAIDLRARGDRTARKAAAAAARTRQAASDAAVREDYQDADQAREGRHDPLR